MKKTSFRKILSANDVGATGGHQGGILIPKSERELLEFLPQLDPAIKNPDAWIECLDEVDIVRKLRFIYYNNRLHDDGGTRNEYRITYLTKYFREVDAREGDTFEISKVLNEQHYTIRIIHTSKTRDETQEEHVSRIKITYNWHKAY
ncbi:EcoRII N-terminal effector-binding domain-containing protein [Pseudomonas neuropathica]|uniref:EcoRII N-terminal effector-binding domain-containing protein n=1 Tax=Pseudomonas neuropathica TaxID=2730425 RepID=UPI003EBA14FB